MELGFNCEFIICLVLVLLDCYILSLEFDIGNEAFVSGIQDFRLYFGRKAVRGLECNGDNKVWVRQKG